MSVEERVITALSGIVPVVVPNVYTGTAKEYIVFNYSTYPRAHANGRPTALVESLQVHLFIPQGKNPLQIKWQIQNALFQAGCTYPSIVNASDGDGQHYVFECELISAVQNG